MILYSCVYVVFMCPSMFIEAERVYINPKRDNPKLGYLLTMPSTRPIRLPEIDDESMLRHTLVNGLRISGTWFHQAAAWITCCTRLWVTLFAWGRKIDHTRLLTCPPERGLACATMSEASAQARHRRGGQVRYIVMHTPDRVPNDRP